MSFQRVSTAMLCHQLAFLLERRLLHRGHREAAFHSQWWTDGYSPFTLCICEVSLTGTGSATGVMFSVENYETYV